MHKFHIVKTSIVLWKRHIAGETVPVLELLFILIKSFISISKTYLILTLDFSFDVSDYNSNKRRYFLWQSCNLVLFREFRAILNFDRMTLKQLY